MRLLLILAVIAAAYFWQQSQQTPSPASPVTIEEVLSQAPPMSQPIVLEPPQVIQPAVSAPQVVAPTRSGGVTSSEAASWCQTNCGHHSFQELSEGGRTIVHMTTGIAARMSIPAGISVDGWDCFNTVQAVGPTQIDLCEAALRRVS